MPSNVILDGAKGLSITNCTFRHLGAGAIQFSRGAQGNQVKSCHFYDVSGTAVQIGRYDDYNVTTSEQQIGNSVTDCNITEVAAEYHGNAGLSVGYSTGTVLSYNYISQALTSLTPAMAETNCHISVLI